MNYGLKIREADEILRHWLESSGIPIGARLPSERQLAKELGFHHSVMNRAMTRVLAEGRVERRGYRLFRCAGTQAAAPPTPCDLVILQRSRRLSSLRKVAQEIGFPLREHLCLSAEEVVARLGELDGSTTECVILVPPHGSEKAGWEAAARKLLQRGIPVTTIGRRLNGLSSVASERGLEQIIKHLAALGHSELALLAASPWTAAIEEMMGRWIALCQRFASESSRNRVIYHNTSHMLREDLLSIADQFNAEWEPVTALVISTDDDLPMQRLIDVLRRRGISIPERLSLISLFDHPALQTAVPPVGAVLEDLAMEHEAAFLLAQRALRKRNRLGLVMRATEIDIALELNERSSLASNTKGSPVAPQHVPNEISREGRPFLELSFDKEAPGEAGQIAYELAKDVTATRFRHLDLANKVNRPLNFRRGWLGDLPLRSLPPGTHTFHGVPFQILGGPTRKNCGAVVFQSLRNTMGSTLKLPQKIRIEVKARAKAIYILHGCGYVKHLARFGSYTFFHQKKELGSVPLVSLGRPRPGAETWELAEAIAVANIQDWWPDYPHCDFRHARRVPLPDSASAGPVRGHIYLYTLEWVNPEPESLVTHLEIEADANQSTTLGVLAISLLQPRPIPPERGRHFK